MMGCGLISRPVPWSTDLERWAAPDEVHRDREVPIEPLRPVPGQWPPLRLAENSHRAAGFVLGNGSLGFAMERMWAYFFDKSDVYTGVL